MDRFKTIKGGFVLVPSLKQNLRQLVCKGYLDTILEHFGVTVDDVCRIFNSCVYISMFRVLQFSSVTVTLASELPDERGGGAGVV